MKKLILLVEADPAIEDQMLQSIFEKKDFHGLKITALSPLDLEEWERRTIYNLKLHIADALSQSAEELHIPLLKREL